MANRHAHAGPAGLFETEVLCEADSDVEAVDPDALEFPEELRHEYQVVGLLGQGAFGKVFDVVDRGDSKSYALKVIGFGCGAARAEREVMAQLSFQGEHIIGCHHAGLLSKSAFLVMEKAKGDLSDILSLPDGPAQAWNALGKVTLALEVLHKQGVIHRDLKPSNILWTDEGAKLADFGLARGGELESITRGDQILGTPGYMSPEQARGEPVEPSSDIFSLAVVYYWLLIGELPYKETHPLRLSVEVATHQLKLKEHAFESLPPLAVEQLKKALHRYPEERPKNLAYLSTVAPPVRLIQDTSRVTKRLSLDPRLGSGPPGLLTAARKNPQKPLEALQTPVNEREIEHGVRGVPMESSAWIPTLLVLSLIALVLGLIAFPSTGTL